MVSTKEDCIFCKIADKEADATVVYEDPHTLAFLDIHPLVFVSVHKVMKGVQKASGSDGISVGQSNGRAASQEIFHMHVHIIPRFNHEMMSGFPNRKQTHRAELDEIGKKVKAAIVAKNPTA